MTRYGKTRVVAIALLLYVLNSVNKKILIIAPTLDQTNIIRNYIAEMIADNTTLCNLVDHQTHTGPEHLKSEMSKKRITFKNGCEIITLTAHGEEGGKDAKAAFLNALKPE
jgi:phage terminase large subunit-like protein